MSMTYIQKLLARTCGRPSVAVGDVVEPRVDLAMSHENAALVLNQFKEIFAGTGRERACGTRHASRSSSTTACRRVVRRRATRSGCASSSRRRASRSSTTSAATPAASCTRSSRRTATCAPARSSSAPTATPRRTGHSGRSPSAWEPPRWPPVWTLGTILNVEVPGTIRVNVTGRLPDGRVPEGRHPPPDWHAAGRGRQLQGDRSSAGGRAGDADLRAPHALQHERGGGATAGVVPPTMRRFATCARRPASQRPSTCSARTPPPRTTGWSRSTARALTPQIACPHTVDNVKPVESRWPARPCTRS